ncbi:hypothetical protein [Eubacterium aggregans]|uniref:hypothetical protein n=1 Tax=Eubacterium aggregans TaxID=81409 RepID=UPI003F2AB85F
MGNPQLTMKGVFKKATTSKLNQPGDSLSLYLFTAQQKTQLRPQPVVKTSGPVDERSEWDLYVPKEGQLSVAINKVQANGGIESKYKDTERMVVTDTQTISGKINGAQQTK